MGPIWSLRKIQMKYLSNVQQPSKVENKANKPQPQKVGSGLNLF